MKRPLLLFFVVLLAACRGTPTTPTPDSTGGADLAAMGYFGDEAAATSAGGDCPGAADGSELVGVELPEWQLDDWRSSKPLSLAALRGRVVVIRFWTSGCPFCEQSMPALQRLSEELKGQPVTFVGAFHGKPADTARDMHKPAALAASWGVTFPLALDRDWRTLRSWWLDRAHRHATSVTFVIGADGRVKLVHPGPTFYPSDDPTEADANRDYLAIRQAILTELKAP